MSIVVQFSSANDDAGLALSSRALKTSHSVHPGSQSPLNDFVGGANRLCEESGTHQSQLDRSS
ncbi:hypothetical protein CBOM_07983 [Ceraceosorus bombacis]|uniref:Uncharacterized protein n=1 Tax=Ceraceosorus bombacis TaxID=401625 RepID=A0A0P1BJE1_9BASI|nr:hypothetical protein CBOM_07983 [Ceraceosorus bombacis]